MKRFLLLPILIFGLSFACDQPYEEVSGYKIGCPLGSSADYRQYTAGDDIYGGSMVFKDIDNLHPFEIEAVLMVEGTVEGLVFMTPEYAASEEDFYTLVASMQDEWGDPELEEDQDSVAAFFPNDKSRTLSLIGALFNGDIGELMVIYRSQKSLDAEERQEVID